MTPPPAKKIVKIQNQNGHQRPPTHLVQVRGLSLVRLANGDTPQRHQVFQISWFLFIIFNYYKIIVFIFL